MKNKLIFFLSLAILILTAPFSEAAYESRFDAINFDPAIDGGNYFTVYGSRTHKAWQGTLGIYVDYANRPLEFRTTGGTSSRQSVLDHTLIGDFYGSLGFTDWFTAGLNIPVVFYNWFFTDNAAAQPDKGSGMGDIMVVTKFRFLDIDEKSFGIAVVPFMTLPTGDIVRYNGNGHVTGGLKLVFDARLHERFEIALNVGGVLRDDVTRNFVFAGGATSSIRIDDYFTFGMAGNIKFTKNFQGIIEGQGTTVFRSFFSSSNTTAIEAGGGIRYFIGDSGFAIDAGGMAGIIEGVGTPRFRGFIGLRWTSPITQDCPPCAPDPRIKDDKIVLWGKIFFDTAKATIKPISYPVLDDVVDVLNTHPEITLVEVQGHTDSRGSDAYNQRLSQRRAQSAMQYLINKGISPSRLRAKGYGENQPIATNNTVEGMSQNRRTEFVILQSSGGYMTKPNPLEISSNNSIQHTPSTTQAPTPIPTNVDSTGGTYPVSDDKGNPLPKS